MKLYRKRFIPSECILLKDDIILEVNDEHIITKWQTLNPKVSFSHGCSCYFLKDGIKVSKFYRHDDSLLFWYCDIVEYDFMPKDDSMIVTDLLADVIVYPDGRFKVMDLDELADAFEQRLITEAQLCASMRTLNKLLNTIDCGSFDIFKAPLEDLNI